MKEVFDLDLYVRENIDEILKCKKENKDFYYDEEAVNAVYKLATDLVKKCNIDKQQRDDLVQDCVGRFFAYVVYKWDPKKEASISTWAYIAFKNICLLYINNKQRKFDECRVSLDKKVIRDDVYCEDSNELIDFIETNDLNALDEYIRKEENDFLKDKLLNDEILYKYFYEDKSLRDIGEEMGYSRTTISTRIERKLKQIRKEYDLKYGDIKVKNKR